MNIVPSASRAGTARAGLWQRVLFGLALVTTALATPSVGQPVPCCTGQIPLPAPLLPETTEEQLGVVIGWYSNNLSAAQARALERGKPLIVIHFSDLAAAKPKVDIVTQAILPCGEINGLAGRAVFATTQEDQALLLLQFSRLKLNSYEALSARGYVSVHLPENGTLRLVRSFVLPGSAAELAAQLSPFVGTAVPSTKPYLNGIQMPWLCRPSGARP